jgi:hypothetical protein
MDRIPDKARVYPIPTVIKTGTGKERTSTGRWSNKALADYIVAHPATMHTCKTLASIGHGSATPSHIELARHLYPSDCQYLGRARHPDGGRVSRPQDFRHPSLSPGQ